MGHGGAWGWRRGAPAEPPAIKEESSFDGHTDKRRDEDPIGLPGELPVQHGDLDYEEGEKELHIREEDVRYWKWREKLS